MSVPWVYLPSYYTPYTGFSLSLIVISSYLGLLLSTYCFDISSHFLYAYLHFSIYCLLSSIIVASVLPSEVLYAVICLVITMLLGSLVIQRSLGKTGKEWNEVVEAAVGLYMDFCVLFWGIEVGIMCGKALIWKEKKKNLEEMKSAWE